MREGRPHTARSFLTLLAVPGIAVGFALALVVGRAGQRIAEDGSPGKALSTAPAAVVPAGPGSSPGAGEGFAGRPAAGTVLWGASLTGNTDPAQRHEQPAGVALGLRRTFYQWHHRTTYLIDTARHDLTTGRLPWVSIKPPSWTDMAAGKHDHEIDQLLTALDRLDGPVWLTIHHEPEGGGGSNTPDDPAGPSAHLAMNRRVRERMTALATDNIALAPILMSWTFDPRSGRNPDHWWAPDVYDFLGIDHYRDEQATLLTPRWATIRTWAATQDVDIAVGEWGLRGTDTTAAQHMRDWHTAALTSATDGNGARVIALSAFDSSLNSPTGSWELTGHQLTTFHQLLKHPQSARLAEPAAPDRTEQPHD